MAKKIVLGVLGQGTVGTGLIELLARNREEIARRADIEFVVKRAVVRDPGKPRVLDRGRISLNADDIFHDPEIDIVAELIGGIEPARTFILKALQAGKAVVTANKAVLAAHGHEILVAAARAKRPIGFEASVGGGIPIIRALTSGLVANRFDEMLGILNGTTNYILTRMAEQGRSYADVLAEAQKLGLAEADPSADVLGIDAANKLAILAELMFQVHATVGGQQGIRTEGIDRLAPEDFDAAKAHGYTIKLTAVAKRVTGGFDLRVHPTFVPHTHPLAAVRDEFNAVMLKGDAVGEMIFLGKGAGAMPTASAVLSDLVEIARNPTTPTLWKPALGGKIVPVEDTSRFYLRFPILDVPGAIGRIATVLGEFEVSITDIEATLVPGQKGYGSIRVLTHDAPEGAVRRAFAAIRQAGGLLSSEPLAIRVVG